MTQQRLGFVQPLTHVGPKDAGRGQDLVVAEPPEQKLALWPGRWPVVALDSCIQELADAPPGKVVEVRLKLPCGSCESAGGCLTAKRKEIGPIMYDRELLTTPRSSGSSLFPMEMFKPCLRPDRPLVPYWHKPFMDEGRYRVVQAWDLAWSEKVGGDWLVCMTGCVDLEDGTRSLLDVMRWQQVEFADQVKLIEAQCKQYGADLVVIESDAAQSIWAQHVGKTTAVPVMKHTAGEKTNLASGVPSLLIALANRKWVIPYMEGTYHHENVVAFLNEAEAFSWVDGKLQGVGEHDDLVMCWWHLSWGMGRFLSAGTAGETHRGVQDGVH